MDCFLVDQHMDLWAVQQSIKTLTNLRRVERSVGLQTHASALLLVTHWIIRSLAPVVVSVGNTCTLWVRLQPSNCWPRGFPCSTNSLPTSPRQKIGKKYDQALLTTYQLAQDPD